jgi:hypothetical protein
MLADLDPPATDPRAVAAVLMRLLAAALDADPGNVGLARELRQLLTFTVALGEGGLAGELSQERMRLLRGRVDAAIKSRHGVGT